MIKIPIIICGGHFTPALAIIESLGEDKKIKLYYLGRKYSLTGDKALSFEFRQISKLKMPFLSITMGRFNRFLSFETALILFKFPVGLCQSLIYLIKIRPKLIISFGSYVALPICIMAYIFRIPIVTHEQTRVMGLTNRIISLFSQKVCLSYSDTKKVPQFINTETTGIPLRNSIIHPSDTGITRFGRKNFPLIFISGGSQGSVSINAVIYLLLKRLVKNFRLFHICGQSQNNFDYHRLSKLRLTLDRKYRGNYYLTPFLDHAFIGEVLKNSNLYIGRSGGNSIAEIAYFGNKAILIPLPWAADNEQFENAKFMEKLNLAIIINQRKLTADILFSAITELLNRPQISPFKLNILRGNLDGRDKLVKIVKEQIGENF